ncbi:MAG TPA: Wzz/FepE/Etk N-terminal domain-containing protein [Patescibacteria group bacterium]|nr:Wzz/FepE/Etk N-terminal domain-containing protein [Patescibacteria group bacterium]
MKNYEKVNKMEIRNFLNILSKRLWLVILVPFLAAAVTGVINFYVLEPVYESSITLYVMNKDLDSKMRLAYDDILATQQLMKDCRELIKSKSITRAVIEQLSIEDLTNEDLAKKITVSFKNDTRMLEIKVRDTSKVRAMFIVNAINDTFQTRAKSLMQLETLDVVDEAEIPDKPFSPKPIRNIFIVFFTALFLVISVAYIIEYFDDTLKNLEDVEKLLGMSVVGIIPHLDLE